MSEFLDLNQAMLCGIDPYGESRELFETTGLYHLLVVSGSHLVFLAEIIEFLLPKISRKVFVLIPLYIFVLFSGAQPPIVRSFVQIMLGELNNRFRWNWAPTKLAIYAALLTLIVFPSWSISLSFWLSWLASLALNSARVFNSSYLKRHGIIHFILIPALLVFGSLSPLVVFLNAFVAPIIGYVMLPAAFSILIVHQLVPLNNLLWRGILTSLKFFAELIGGANETQSVSPGIFASYVFTLTLIRHWVWRIWRH